MTSAQSSLTISLCRFCSPRYVDFDELERKFWKNLTFNPPLYGADVSGTLYDPVSGDRLHTWNLNILNSVCGRQVGLLKNVVYTFRLCQCYYLSICDKSLSDRISWLSENLSSGAYLQVQCLCSVLQPRWAQSKWNSSTCCRFGLVWHSKIRKITVPSWGPTNCNISWKERICGGTCG